MFINHTVTKKVLENLIRETFLKFGSFSSSSLLDSLKILGFHYATNAGISINIEDLKTPDVKDYILNETTEEMIMVSNNWQQGLLTDIERFQTIIDSWNVATESLKNRIIEYYQNFDPANNLYIMAFSGARGNMSQVRQLVGMRGLMADQSGKIIDLPIQSNFREGLTPIDYIISAYGARKGIVDTALKTADSGYLTRRLIYVAQDLIIREKNCQTKKGIIILFDKKTPSETLIGRSVLSVTKYTRLKKSSLLENEVVLTIKKINEIKKEIPLILNIRSSLTCNSIHSVCQKCYGWDLSQQKFVSLGEAVGIIAAQSIGEPGTQLTMRTFHTGGIFTGETVQQIFSPFSGKFFFPKNFNGIPFRTNHGQIVFKLKNETYFRLLDWKGYEEIISLNAGSYLYLSQSCFLKKGQVIAEYSTQNNSIGERRLKPLYSSIGGQVLYEKIIVNNIRSQKTNQPLSIIQKSGTLWIVAGSLIEYQSEGILSLDSKINLLLPIVKIKVIAPFEGNFCLDSEKNIILSTFEHGKIIFSSEFLKKEIKDDFITSFVPLLRSHQRFDQFTILGYWYIFIKENHIIDQVTREKTKRNVNLCIHSNQNSWKIFLEEPEQKKILKKKNEDKKWKKKQTVSETSSIFRISNLHSFSKFSDLIPICRLIKKKKIRKKVRINSTLLFHRFGVFSFRKGAKLTFHKAAAYFMNSGTTLSYKKNDYIKRNSLLANLISYTQRTEDIVQGLPKIENLIEARIPEFKALLCNFPGMVFNRNITNLHYNRKISKPEQNSWFFSIETYPLLQNEKKGLKVQRPIIEELKPFGRIYAYRPFQILQRNSLKELAILPMHTSLLYLRKYTSPLVELGEAPICSLSQIKQKHIKKQQKVFFQYKIYSIRKKVKLEDLKITLSSKSKLFENPVQTYDLNYLIKQEQEKEKIKEKEREIIRKELKKEAKRIEKIRKEEEKKNKKTQTVSEKIEESVEEHIQQERVKEEQIKKIIEKTAIKKFKSSCRWMIKENTERILYFKRKRNETCYKLSKSASSLYTKGEFIDLGEPITNGMINMHDLLHILFLYHLNLDGVQEATFRSLSKIQLLLVNGVQGIYHSQGVMLSNKHLEIIVRQMTSKVKITKTGSTPLLLEELISLAIMNQIYEATRFSGKRIPKYEPKIVSATKCSLTKNSFLSAAGFQETRRVLTKAAMEGKSDWFRGLKESVIVGRLSPSGSAFLNYKNNLDHLYSFKK